MIHLLFSGMDNPFVSGGYRFAPPATVVMQYVVFARGSANAIPPTATTKRKGADIPAQYVIRKGALTTDWQHTRQTQKVVLTELTHYLEPSFLCFIISLTGLVCKFRIYMIKHLINAKVSHYFSSDDFQVIFSN